MFKNLKEKFKKGFSKKEIISIAIFAVAVIATIIAIVVNQTNEQSSKRKKIVADAELARAMTYDQFEDGDEAVDGTDNVKFSAFFLRDVNNDGYAEKIKGTCKQIGKEDTLYMEVNVQTDGILKNAKVEIDGKNFYLATTAPKDNELKDNYIGTNVKKLEFNDMTNGTQKLITGAVRSGDYSYASSKASAIGSNINNLSRDDNKITFTGTYVGSDGNEIQINKEINLQMDWYGSTSASVSTSTSTYNDIENREDEANGTITLTAEIRSQENNNQLIVKKNYVEGTIPQLNGYDPISVVSELSTDKFVYDKNTKKFTITREAVVNDNGDITKLISRDNAYTLKFVYPLEAYTSLGTTTLTIDIPVMAYYEGYNNQNTEFTNPYKSNEVRDTLTYTFRGINEGETTAEIKVGEYLTTPANRWIVSKNKPLRIYNEASSEEKDDNYIVSWYVSKGDEESSDGIIMKERKDGEDTVSDTFVKADATTESMENITTNIGIGFENANKFIASDGFIKVYDDETDELLVIFTQKDWGKYTKTSPFKFNMPVKHIRVETSQTQVSQYLYVYSLKQLDDEYITANYTKEEFDNLKQIRSNLNVYAGTNLLGDSTSTANYEAPYSVASLSISKNTLSTQITEENEVLTIKATADESANQVAWSNGSFLIKLPQDIIQADINNVEINNSNVSLASYEYIENDNGRFIKINTKNTSTAAQTFEIKIDTNITPDPRIATKTENFELWAANEEGVDYYYNSADIYDINDNLNTTEKVHKSMTAVNLISPNSLLTNQTASNFDKDGTQVVSPQIADVKPQLATVSQDTPEKTVRIGAQIKNNYADVITDVMILGKIPFEGNTYVLSGEDLGSEFTTKMTNAGIEIPEELKDKVVVYYSENEIPDKDLGNAENGWKTAENITNWDNVKTYLIDFQDMEVASGAEYTFYYTIKVPNGEDYNKKSFSHHGVYFALKTSEGKYRTQTEPNKLGIRIAEKYNLELQKYQTGKTNLVPGATYKITKEATDTEDEESKTAVTNAEGKLEIQNLYARRTYSIEEIKTPDNYDLNTDVIKIIGTVQEDGSLQVEKIQGTTRDEIEVTKDGEDQPYKIIVKVEDEAKVRLKIKKTEKDTTTPLRGIRYKLTGDGLPESGKNIATNINGEIIVKGLTVGEEYTLEETKAEGYYLASPIKFTVTNTDGTYTINVSGGTVKESSVLEEENIPTVNIKVEDEKIPTYNLEIFKIQKITTLGLTDDKLKAEEILSSTDTVYLSGAKFKLYKGTKELGSYVTDENGKITLNNLYQYIGGKDEEATYTLKETFAPEGYSKVKDITFKVDGSVGELKFINTEGKEENYTVENNTVKLLVEDNPSFKLIKKDAETNELLANIKFVIYNIDGETQPAKNSKGEIIGTKETINGIVYYIVTTNSNGEISVDLPEGMYKAVEVEAPDKYDILNSSYYFGIGASVVTKEGVKAEWAREIQGTHDHIESVAETSDGGYIVGGNFGGSIDLGNGISLKNKGYTDGMIIKYNAAGEVEWAEGIGGTDNDYIKAVVGTSDGGYIVGGDFNSSSINLENGINLINKDGAGKNYDGMIIKYNEEGEIEWAQGIGGTDSDYINAVAETRDGGYIVGGYFRSSEIDLENGVSLVSKGSDDGMIIKYNANGEVEWGKVIGGTSYEEIKSVAETSDGGCIVVGDFYSISIDLGNGVSLTNKNNYYSYDGMIIKYNANGEVEWAQGIGGSNNDYIEAVAECSDGGYIVGGNFNSSSINLGNGIILTNKGSDDGMIIKYSSNGEAEWAKEIGGKDDQYVNSVAECSDGGYVVGGYFGSSEIDLENGTGLVNEGRINGMIIKYSDTGKVEWTRGIGGTHRDYINSVAECSDGGYIVGGYFDSSSIDLGNGINLINKDNYRNHSMLIKFEKAELENPTTIQAKKIEGTGRIVVRTVAECSDGGHIVGGFFESGSIDLGNGITLTNKGSRDGMIIKYNSNGETEWAEVLGGTNDDTISSVAESSDGGYIVGGYFDSSEIDLGNGICLSNVNSYDGMVIKYSSEGEAEWAKVIGGQSTDYIYAVAECKNGGYIVGGEYSHSLDLENGIKLSGIGYSNGMLIKYNYNGQIEWAKNAIDRITSIVECTDGGCIAGGNFYSRNRDLENGIKLKNKGEDDGAIIKYSSDGKTEWAKTIGGTSGDYIESVAECNDGGYIVGGYFRSSEIDLGNGIILKNKGTDTSDGMIIKYSSTGEIEWAQGIGGTITDRVSSVAECSDGGCLVGGYFESSAISLKNGTNLINKNVASDGMIIKYSNTGEAEWAQEIGGTSYDYISSVKECSDENYIVGGYFISSEIDLGNGKKLIYANNKTDKGFILNITTKPEVSETQKLEVTNSRKEFKITTDVQEIDGTKGGSISGEDEEPYEIIKYGDSSEKEIKMIPDKNYKIIGITVNGEDYEFKANEDGTYTMPTFTNVTEDKHIVVTYSLKDNTIIINKVDKDTKEKLSGATFKLEQLDERDEPDNSEIVGDLTDNGEEYTKVNLLDEVTGRLGDLTNNETYYFVQNEDGTYTPTNSKTYQVANGGTDGIKNSIAESYIPIDLNELTGQYAIVVNSSCSSELSDPKFDLGYACVTEDTEVALLGNTKPFIYIYGEQTAKDYTSAILEGGKTYYLHIGYAKDSDVDSGTDQIVVNSIKLYNVTTSQVRYNFVNNNGKYESTNQREDDTAANSYIPIDLTNCQGEYNLIINAEISSESYDFGYATITEDKTRPDYNADNRTIVSISGIVSAQDYTAILEGGKIYYLHLGYYKDEIGSLEDDKFTINSINVSLKSPELYQTIVKTNSIGQAIAKIPFGKYSITELEAPDKYLLNEAPTIIDFKSGDDSLHEFTIEDQAKTKLTVHHYIKGTTTKLAEDQEKYGRAGDSYTTNPKLDLDKYELETDENGKLVLPENATGTYTDKPTEVTYYYVEKKIPLTVHHYIEGTTTQVPLKAGGTAGDQVDSGKEGETYTTLPISDENLSDEYELSETPTNANGTYFGEEVIVTYYYKKVTRKVNLIKYQQDGVTPLQGAKFDIQDKDGEKNNVIKIEEVKTTEIDYYMEEKDGKYVSNNQGKSSSTANSYIKIDMTKANKDATITVNAEISSESKYDIGYAIITQAEYAPSYKNSAGRFIYISGTQSAKDYTTIIPKGSVYYLHFGYGKDSTGNSGTDTFTVNSIKINGIDFSERTINLYDTTNEQGKIQVDLEPGTYEVTEVEAPEGYQLPENPTTEIIITKATTSEDIAITNEKKTGIVTVHHYVEGTTNKITMADGSSVEDEIKTGNIGDIYATAAKEGIADFYELVSEPENSSGNYIEGNIEVTYYYRLKKYLYTVNYLEKDTNEILHESKQGDELVHGSTVNSNDEKIDIEGYKFDSFDKEALTIGTTNNVINIYYTKRNDLSYTVNYLEKATNKVLHGQKVQDGMTFESVVTSADEVIAIDGYDYDSVDKNSLTITTGENVINIYYTKKDTKVTVHYYEEGTTNKVSEDVEIPGKVFDNYETESATDIPSKYELVAEPENKNGTMTEDEITVIYYYRKKATQVIVHYYEEGTDKKLSENVTIDGRVDDLYTTVSATDVPIKYELVETPDNASGMMTEDTIEVIYYYRVKDAVVNVRYLEKGTDAELADPDRLDGKVEDDYQTSAKNIDGYQLVEHTGNERGKFEVEPLTITYYYLYKTKATVQYIDKTTGAILEQSTTKGLEGDEFETESKDFENYVLVEEPAEKTVKMTKEEQVLKYYYSHVSGGVIEKHIDVISGQILANAVHNGNEGDAYNIPSRTFDGYDLVEDKLPENAKGTMKVDPVEVIYYYIYRSQVTAEYIDKTTGNRLTEDEIQDGHEGDNYTTERKLFDGYKLIEVPANADGTMTKEDIIVKYYYVRTSGGVIVNHLDIKTNKQLLDETKEEGYEGDPYETHEENISGYDLVKEKYPENAKGTMTTETIRVIYYYIKKTEVNVKYVDSETGEEIDVPTNIPGHEGDGYKTEPKDVPGYNLIEEPENKDGTMTADPTDVIYYYRRPAKVIVNYYDADTKEKLADEVEITGNQNDEYTTEQKDIKYYKIETLPVNKDGKMTVTVTKDENGKEIVEDTTYVNYYYRKLVFNLRVDKTIASVIVNGQETAINGNLGKVEVHRKDISTANVKVVYKIKVTNDSELTGKANVVENIPSGMTMKAENNLGWTINETTASIETDEVKPGESREYQVVLGWQNVDSNIGTKENVASIVTENEAGFNEQFNTDNVSRANLIVAVGTGEIPYVAIAGGVLMIMIAMTVGVYVIKKRK